MSDSRARANHELYLAKIVLWAWRRDLDQQDISASTLAQAFQGGVREHLVAAYGWFLLAISQGDTPSRRPPRGCQELAPMPEGMVFPGEINEFRQLEANGWLGDMLMDREINTPRSRLQDNLAVVSANLPGTEQVEFWLDQLETLFERMSDSLDEY